ncbi:MAG: hydrogenase maturation nickel metallochaperone HypA [Anaerolineae bacterium]|nr:hydrogenase maturation nickel metallochaperone HypA [Anaerolineae bacterium]
MTSEILVEAPHMGYNSTTYPPTAYRRGHPSQHMHELAITQNILEIAVRHAEKANAHRITHLNLVIGELASIIDDSVQFYWDIISRDSIAEGSQLHFERHAAQLRCTQCSHMFPLNSSEYQCPACGDRHVVACGGDEFRLESIEVE